MNEQDNAALIQTLYAAFGKGDIETIIRHLDPGVEWITEGPAIIPYARKLVGPTEVLEFFKAIAETQENISLHTDNYIAQGDKVATSGRYMGNVKATGKRFDSPLAHVFTIRSGKVTQFLNFFDTAAMADAYQSS